MGADINCAGMDYGSGHWVLLLRVTQVRSFCKPKPLCVVEKRNNQTKECPLNDIHGYDDTSRCLLPGASVSPLSDTLDVIHGCAVVFLGLFTYIQ